MYTEDARSGRVCGGTINSKNTARAQRRWTCLLHLPDAKGSSYVRRFFVAPPRRLSLFVERSLTFCPAGQSAKRHDCEKRSNNINAAEGALFGVLTANRDTHAHTSSAVRA